MIETAHLIADAGLIVSSRSSRRSAPNERLARERLKADQFMEIFVDTPLAECERRDPKGLYRKARSGKLKNFTGIDSAYESPGDPDIHIRTPEMTVEQEVDLIIDALRERGVFD